MCYAEDFSFSSSSLQNSPFSTGTINQEIVAILNAKENGLLYRSNFEYRADDVETLYKSNNYTPIWIGNAQTEKNITEVLNLLSNAGAQGLNANDYSANTLLQKLPAILQLKPDDNSADLALYDTALSISLVRFLHDIHYGRVNPRNLDFKLKLRTKKAIDIPKLIRIAFSDGTISQLASNVEPNLQQYHQLRSALAVYRAMRSSGLHDDKRSKAFTGKKVNIIQRITQIELAMERLRWLPEMTAGQSIIVNIPSFQLWAIDATDQNNPPVLNLKVVVGKALKHQTPILMADLRYIEFMPYWNVPISILKNEIFPKLGTNPNYLSGQNMELVSLRGNNDGSLYSQVMQGNIRIRQRPGGQNALGRIKFVLPNKDGVYMHDTPSKALFARTRRDFSHGCVRVQHPSALAHFVLRNQDGWTEDRIDNTLSMDNHRQISLKNPIPVLFFYATAFYEQGDKLSFYDDIYGHDAALLSALMKVDDVPDHMLIANEPEKAIEPSHIPTIESFDSQLF